MDKQSRGFWGRNLFSQGPLKTKSQVLSLAKKLKEQPITKDAGEYAAKYWNIILAQPNQQQRLVDLLGEK